MWRVGTKHWLIPCWSLLHLTRPNHCVLSVLCVLITTRILSCWFYVEKRYFVQECCGWNKTNMKHSVLLSTTTSEKHVHFIDILLILCWSLLHLTRQNHCTESLCWITLFFFFFLFCSSPLGFVRSQLRTPTSTLRAPPPRQTRVVAIAREVRDLSYVFFLTVSIIALRRARSTLHAT